jgi:hypothetical protein
MASYSASVNNKIRRILFYFIILALAQFLSFIQFYYILV